MREYTKLDMIRIVRFAKEPEGKGLKGVKLLATYDKKYPELSEKQKVINLCKALGMDDLYKKMTGENLSKETVVSPDKVKQHPCTEPDCDCLEQAEEANGGQGVKSYPCLAGSDPMGTLKEKIKFLNNQKEPQAK